MATTTKASTGLILSWMFVGVCAVSHVSTFAQSNTDKGRDARRSSQDAARAYVAARVLDDELMPASNLQFSAAYQPLVEEMLSRSPTFRRQYARRMSPPHQARQP